MPITTSPSGGGGATPALAAVLAVGNDAGNGNITDLADPINPQDAATKNYSDTLALGGDLSGTAGAASVIGLNGVSISSVTTSTVGVINFNGDGTITILPVSDAGVQNALVQFDGNGDLSASTANFSNLNVTVGTATFFNVVSVGNYETAGGVVYIYSNTANVSGGYYYTSLVFSGTIIHRTLNFPDASGTIELTNTIRAVNAGGTGQTTYTNGQLLIGNTTGNTLTKSTLTQGTGITITNSTGSITIAVAVPMTVDTGWTANADSGDKTASIPSQATVATAAGLLSSFSGVGALLIALASKVKALETALVAQTLPNA